MKIKYFQEADTLYIEFKATAVVETRDLTRTRCVETHPHAPKRLTSLHGCFSVEYAATEGEA
ncbi:MAG TPA: DUF2283 domain-containing protein [Tepidisphaeraceae bacterium]|nr:DUF2283 domain-containing protein [Tepidisphaeraceae bacterium]